MKSYWIVAIVAVLFAAGARESRGCVAGMQQPVPDAKPAEQIQLLIAGTTDLDKPPSTSDKGDGSTAKAETPRSEAKSEFYILAEFTGSLNGKKLKPGDSIKAQVIQDVLSHGTVVIPVESKLVGHVTEVRARSGEGRESRLGVVFDKVLLKRHQELNFQGVIQALSPPAPRRSRLDDPDPMTLPVVVNPSQSSVSNVPMGGTPTRAGASSGMPNSTVPNATPNASLPSTNSRLPSANMTTVISRPNGTLIVRSVPSDGVSSIGTISDAGLNPAGGVGQQKPMSSRMPRGVFGLKGLSLSTGSSSTPGPVILSEASNVKLEEGTQMLLKVTAVTAP